MIGTDLDKIAEALARSEAYSPYLAMLMRRFPDRVEALRAGDLSDARPVISENKPPRTALRVAKARQALTLAIADIAGAIELEEVVQSLSDFADAALDVAIRIAIEAYMPDAAPKGFAAIALGKHGSRELNYSSDIDPILIFDPDTLPCRNRDEPEEAAVRIGRHIVETMHVRDGDGYVFRIDLRLRPSPEVTPIVLPVNAAISYYESQALPWERAAFIRSRACSGDLELGRHFLRTISPFIWRRGLDFGAVTEIRNITQKIRSHHSRGQIFGPGFDLKRGQGGIRDVEFHAQIHQLIFGGRDAKLREPATLDALDVLARSDRLPADQAKQLAAAYRLYRTIEHRIQMIDDQQTHSLPTNSEDLDAVALLHGLKDGAGLLALLAPHIAAVSSISDAAAGQDVRQVPEDNQALVDILGKAGFIDLHHATQRIVHWRSGSIRAIRTPAARDAFEAVLPALIIGLGAAPDPAHAINQFSNLIERLPSAVNLFRLLEAQPKLLSLLVTIICEAPTLAEQLAQRVELLDSLIDSTAFDATPTLADLKAKFHVAGDMQDQLDHVRRMVSEERFALGVQVVTGTCDPLVAARHYAVIAEAAINSVANATIKEYEKLHGRVPGSELVILALGRMGGSELTHASDLDLIFLFTGDFDSESDAEKPLGASHYYNRLVQRIVVGLSVSTAAGPLYEVDTRLRPSGAKGPLAVSVTSFAQYQREEAWTWEHMALTRARVVYGSQVAREAVDTEIKAILRSKRDPNEVHTDAKKMRHDMLQHKPPKSELDVKLLPGGLVDLEFAIHVLQLCERAAFHPELGMAAAALVKAGLATANIVDAHAFLTRLLVAFRLVSPDGEAPQPSQRAVIARACSCADWADLLSELESHRQAVSEFWRDLQYERKE